MFRKFKVQGLAIGAITVISALSAAAAQAQPEFTTESGTYPVTYSGAQKNTHTLTIGTKTLTCATVKFHGSAAAKSKSATLTPTYEECHTVVLGATFDVTVTTNGCSFGIATTADITAPYDAVLVISCPTKPIEIHVYNGAGVAHTAGNETCTYDVPSQTVFGNFVQLANVVAGDINAITNGVNMSYTKTVGSSLACGAETGTAEYNGETVIAGTVGGGAANIHVK